MNSASHIALTHGQTLWLLTEIGFRQGVDGSTFNYYIKSLRKIGIPFEKTGGASGYRQATYDFDALMELSTALLLRKYGYLPDVVSAGLRDHREKLKPIYGKALAAIDRSECGATIVGATGERCVASGVYVDFHVRYADGEQLRFGPPRALTAFEALSVFAQAGDPGRVCMPINMSALAERLVDSARDLPQIWRGRAAKHHPSVNPFSISSPSVARGKKGRVRKQA